MNEQNFMDADYEVIARVNRGHGNGGGTSHGEDGLYPL